MENEIYRLTVWANTSNETKRGADHHSTTERSMLEVRGSSSPVTLIFNVRDQNNWPAVVRTLWEIDPAIAVHMMERFKSPAAHAEVERLVRSSPPDVAHTPEGLRYLIDDSTRTTQKRELKVGTPLARIFLGD